MDESAKTLLFKRSGPRRVKPPPLPTPLGIRRERYEDATHHIDRAEVSDASTTLDVPLDIDHLDRSIREAAATTQPVPQDMLASIQPPPPNFQVQPLSFRASPRTFSVPPPTTTPASASKYDVPDYTRDQRDSIATNITISATVLGATLGAISELTWGTGFFFFAFLSVGLGGVAYMFGKHQPRLCEIVLEMVGIKIREEVIYKKRD